MIQADPVVWVYAIDIPSSPLSKFRLTAYPQSVFFERDSLGGAIEYFPGSIGHEDVRADTEGSIPKVRLTVQNITREAVALAQAYSGLIGQKVRTTQVRLGDMPDGVPLRDEVYDILEESESERAVEFVLGRAALTQKKFPDRRAQRKYCAHAYGRAGCGYDTARVGALQTCDKTEDGANGCIVHGLNEAAALLPNRHPARILLFRGIPRTSGVGVT